MIFVSLALGLAATRIATAQSNAASEAADSEVLVRRLMLEGNSGLSDTELRELAEISEESPITTQGLTAAQARMLRGYHDRGYRSARVEVLVRETDDPQWRAIRFEIAEGPRTKIRRVVLTSDLHDVAAERLARLAVLEDEPLDDAIVSRHVAEALKRLRSAGWYEATIETRALLAGANATLLVRAHFGPRYSLRIFGSSPIGPNRVSDILKLQDQALRPNQIAALAEPVQTLFARSGFLDARAFVVRRCRSDRECELRITIERGPPVEVEQLLFPGARHFDERFLRDQVYSYLEETLPGSSALHPVDANAASDIGLDGRGQATGHPQAPSIVIDPRTIYEPNAYEAALAHIKELYEAEGYLHATIGPVELIRSDSEHARVRVPITEGPETRISRIVLQGTSDIAPDVLLRAIDIDRGAPHSPFRMERARLALREVFQEAGFYFVQVRADAELSQDSSAAELTFTIAAGKTVRVRRILVQGAARTNPAMIRDRMGVDPGDLLRPSTLREAQVELATLGIFTSVSVSPSDPDVESEKKDLVVAVVERLAQWTDWSAGFSSGEGARGRFEYGVRNLFGYALDLSLRTSLAYPVTFLDPEVERRYDALSAQERIEGRIAASLALPYTPFLPKVRTSLDFIMAQENERDFGTQRLQGALSFLYRPLDVVALTLSGEVETNNVELFVEGNLDQYLTTVDDPQLKRLLRVPDGKSTLVASSVQASLDLRDNPFTPERGLFASITGEWARTVDTEQAFHSHFVKVSVAASGYQPIAEHVVLAGHVRFGRVFHLDQTSITYPNRRFFLGGFDTIRGFLQDSLIPQDVADELAANPAISPQSVFRGGDTFLLLRLELRFPIFRILEGAVFADAGNLWTTAESFDPLNLRPTAGAGVRLRTPIGLIAFDYGFNLRQRKFFEERLAELHFSIGVF